MPNASEVRVDDPEALLQELADVWIAVRRLFGEEGAKHVLEEALAIGRLRRAASPTGPTE